MSGQMIIVYVIGVAVGAYLVYRIYRVVGEEKRRSGPTFFSAYIAARPANDGGEDPPIPAAGGKTAAAGSPRSGPVEPAGSVRSIFVETD